jgi:hypothetical protein
MIFSVNENKSFIIMSFAGNHRLSRRSIMIIRTMEKGERKLDEAGLFNMREGIRTVAEYD